MWGFSHGQSKRGPSGVSEILVLKLLEIIFDNSATLRLELLLP